MTFISNKNCKRKAKKHFLEFVEDDYSELWVLSEFLYNNLKNATKETVLSLVKEIISEFILEDKMVALDVKTEKPAKLSKTQILSEIDLIFKQTNGKPTIGDGLWFDIKT